MHAYLPVSSIKPPTERARPLPAARMFPQETSAANAAFLHDPTRENAMPDSPQAVRHCSIKIILPLFMRGAHSKSSPHCRRSGTSFARSANLMCISTHHCVSTSLPQALRLTAHPGSGCTPPWKRNGRGCARPSDGWWTGPWARTGPPTGSGGWRCRAAPASPAG